MYSSCFKNILKQLMNFSIWTTQESCTRCIRSNSIVHKIHPLHAFTKPIDLFELTLPLNLFSNSFTSLMETLVHHPYMCIICYRWYTNILNPSFYFYTWTLKHDQNMHTLYIVFPNQILKNVSTNHGWHVSNMFATTLAMQVVVVNIFVSNHGV